VNEYPPGVGLSPHIDTHSAFEGSIYSLSLAGPCIMEFRKYSEGDCFSKPVASGDGEEEDSGSRPNFLRRAIFLSPRSMLLLSGEARYAWHHYIPHHKVDIVKDSVVKRGSRRVSFTFREKEDGDLTTGPTKTVRYFIWHGDLYIRYIATFKKELKQEQWKYCKSVPKRSGKDHVNANILKTVILRDSSGLSVTLMSRSVGLVARPKSEFCLYLQSKEQPPQHLRTISETNDGIPISRGNCLSDDENSASTDMKLRKIDILRQ
ncbi:hypothetical protein RJ640_029699, partial [Escallonia rubra]